MPLVGKRRGGGVRRVGQVAEGVDVDETRVWSREEGGQVKALVFYLAVVINLEEAEGSRKKENSEGRMYNLFTHLSP